MPYGRPLDFVIGMIFFCASCLILIRPSVCYALGVDLMIDNTNTVHKGQVVCTYRIDFPPSSSREHQNPFAHVHEYNDKCQST